MYINLLINNFTQKVLEIAAAKGYNFHIYPNNIELTVLEYNCDFENLFKSNVKKHGIDLDQYIIGDIENMHQLADNTFDIVLVTHVLCSVNDEKKALGEVRRVLKSVINFNFIY